MKPVTYKYVELVEWDDDLNEKPTGKFAWIARYGKCGLGFHETRGEAQKR